MTLLSDMKHQQLHSGRVPGFQSPPNSSWTPKQRDPGWKVKAKRKQRIPFLPSYLAFPQTSPKRFSNMLYHPCKHPAALVTDDFPPFSLRSSQCIVTRRSDTWGTVSVVEKRAEGGCLATTRHENPAWGNAGEQRGVIYPQTEALNTAVKR